MAVTLSVPTMWSARIKAYLDKALVYRDALTNDLYAGEIREAGDSVKILNIGPVTVSDYTGTLAAPQDLTDEALTLTVNQKKAFNFKVDDVDDQASVIRLVDQGSQRAAYAMSDEMDKYLASFHAEAAVANNHGSSVTPVVVGFGAGETSPYDAHLILAEKLTEANVPLENRRVVYPAWFVRILKRQLGLERDTAMGDTQVQQGEIATPIDGVRVFQSNNVLHTSGSRYKAIMGIPVITFAQTIIKTETYRVEAAFATGVKGLNVYGAKVTHPTALAVGTYDKGQLTK